MILKLHLAMQKEWVGLGGGGSISTKAMPVQGKLDANRSRFYKL